MPDYWFNIRALKWHGFLTGLRFYLPIIFVYLAQNGLSFSEIGLLFAAQNIAKLLATVPCGVTADRWGRKHCVAWSSFAFALAFVLYGVGDSFFVFLLAGLFQGTAQALLSGSEEALTYDSLNALGERKGFAAHFGQKYALYGYAMALSAVAATWIVAVDVKWTFYLTSIFLFVSGVLVLFVREPARPLGAGRERFSQHLGTALSELKGQVTARWLALYIVVMLMSFQVFIQYLQPLMLGTGFELSDLGYLYAGFTAVSAGGAACAGLADRRLSGVRFWVVAYVALSLGYLGAAFSDSWLGVMFFAGMVQFINGLLGPVLNAHFHHQLRSKHRATIHAFRQLFLCLALVALFPLFGLLADEHGYEAVLMALGIVVLVFAGLPLSRLLARRSRVSEPPALTAG